MEYKAYLERISSSIRLRLNMFPTVFVAGVSFAIATFVVTSFVVNFAVFFFVNLLNLLGVDQSVDHSSPTFALVATNVFNEWSAVIFCALVVYLMHVNSSTFESGLRKDSKMLSYVYQLNH